MKKSEMIELLGKFGGPEADFDPEELLIYIEKAGMLPPTIQWQETVINKKGEMYAFPKVGNNWEEDFILDGEKGEL